jgi:hypothetical protein
MKLLVLCFELLRSSALGCIQVGVAQQWYDELDNLAFATPDTELTVEDNNTTKDNKYQDERVHINCAVNSSPGTSEVCLLIFCISICFLHCSKATESWEQ